MLKHVYYNSITHIKHARWRSRSPSPVRQMSDREIVEAMNAVLRNEESKKAIEKEKVFVEQKVEKTMIDLKNLWSNV